ncbi:MAG: response regulator transcription factor [Acinetobacter sp.]|nr:response regulator transcription factor [Acinetobacter sp.]
MVNDLILPVPVLIINHLGITPELRLKNILNSLGYPQELLMQSPSIENAKNMITEHLPNLIFYNVQSSSDLNFIHLIKQTHPSSYLVTLHQAEHTQLIFDAIQMGSNAYLLNETPLESSLKQLKTILRGGAVMHPLFADFLLLHKFNGESPTASDHHLYPPKYQILQLISQEYTVEQIAQQLKLSTYQVDSLIKAIFRKLFSR